MQVMKIVLDNHKKSTWELSKQSTVATSQIYRINESNYLKATVKLYADVAKFLNITVDELIKEIDSLVAINFKEDNGTWLALIEDTNSKINDLNLRVDKLFNERSTLEEQIKELDTDSEDYKDDKKDFKNQIDDISKLIYSNNRQIKRHKDKIELYKSKIEGQ